MDSIIPVEAPAALDGYGDEAPLTSMEKLSRMASSSGDVSGAFSATKLAEIGETCIAAYERDKADRKDWEDIAREAIAACAQEEVDKAKTFPWAGASNMKWPLLTIAAMQFNARMYPAVVKGDEAVLCKVIGSDNGKPVTAPNPIHGAVQPVPQIDPVTGGLPVDPASGQPILQPQWLIPPGAKAKRALRVGTYLNTILFYRMDNWEDDTDSLLMQLPAAGCVFRKQWADENGEQHSATISALNLVVPMKSRSLESALRITERIEDVYPYEIREKQRRGIYREVDLSLAKPGENRDDDGARLLLEQHCLWDFDDDGVEEPYIVTLDYQTHLVLRIEPNFGPEDVEQAPDGSVIRINPRSFYTKYPMFPHPDGKFYDIGLGHLLKKLGDGINTMLNQLIDAGTAQTAGGGFIGSGVRLQSRGARGVVRFEPGEYKTVDVDGTDLKNAIVERTLPNVSPVTFQLLDMLLGASRDIAGIKDVMTGEASNMGQVGTTLALIEQGLQVFNATAKRLFRALKKDFSLLYDNVWRFGGDRAAQDYLDTIDDPEADFQKDFDPEGLDIRPVSDPASITRMQKMAKAQFMLGLLPQIVSMGGDGREVLTRVLEAVDTEDIDKIFPPKQPPDPQQVQMQMNTMMENLRLLSANADEKQATAQSKIAKTMLDAAEAAQKRFDLARSAGEHGMALGAAAAQAEHPAP